MEVFQHAVERSYRADGKRQVQQVFLPAAPGEQVRRVDPGAPDQRAIRVRQVRQQPGTGSGDPQPREQEPEPSPGQDQGQPFAGRHFLVAGAGERQAEGKIEDHQAVDQEEQAGAQALGQHGGPEEALVACQRE